jgi:hypothetical protein
MWPESANAPCPRALTCVKTMASQGEKPKVGFYNFHGALLHKHYKNHKAHAGIERIFLPYNEPSK